MKIKAALLLFFVFFCFVLQSQNQQVTSYNLQWKNVESWHLDSTLLKVISFEGAGYPAADRIPHFHQQLIAESGFSYNVILKNPVFIPLIPSEIQVLNGNTTFPTEPEVNSTINRSRENAFLDISILPIVNKNGNLMKLQSFELGISKTPAKQNITSLSGSYYASNSVLAQGKFTKIKIVNTGIYKLTYEDLQSMGINPANVRIFGYGGNVLDQTFSTSKPDDLSEVSIYMNKGSDGVFNAGDYILFYGLGINKWTFDKSKSIFTHKINSYSNYGYYFVTSDAGTGKKISDKAITLPAAPVINNVEEFTDYQVHEKELINFTFSGKEFYGEPFSDITSYNFPFSFPNPVTTTNSTVVRLDVAGLSTTPANFTLSLNNSQSQILTLPARTQGDNYEQARDASGMFLYTPQGDPFNFNISFAKPAASSVGYLNYLEVNARRKLTMSGSAMQFQNMDYLGQSTYNQYLLSNANSSIQIWDITDPQNIGSIPTQTVNGKMSFIDSGNELKSYLAIDPTASSSFSKPEVVGIVANQNLHSISQADMVIITHPDFKAQAETLAQLHHDKDNLSVSVVTTEQVYNEFSSGAPDATAYRWVMKMLYDRAKSSGSIATMPRYLLLFGRGSYDNRNLIPNSGDKMILTYQTENSLVTTLSYTTDDYFGLLDDTDGNQIPANLMDIGVGRLPVATVQQATNVVTKISNYVKNEDKGSWKNQLCFLADDGDASLHAIHSDSIASMTARNFPAYQVDKIFLDAFKQESGASGQSYPVAKTQLLNLIQSGILLLNYTGHAGATGLSNESILSLSDVKNLNNTHLPMFMGATCDFLQFDVQNISGGEQLLLNPNGGAIGVLSAARPVYASQNLTLDKLFCEYLFKKQNGKQSRLGDIIMNAKNNVGTEINKLSYVFMGDPALKLNFPSDYKIITSKINKSTTFGKDTLRAMSADTIQGYIADDNGNTVNNFNGRMHVTIYDKLQIINTLNNDGDGGMSYYDRPNTLYAGNVDVKKGKFSFSFMLPKDIKYNYGCGRINYYAKNEDNSAEAQGYFENFIIGGTNTGYATDTVGPNAHLYLNSENFVSGGKVNQTPLFIAKLSDKDGINTMGSGIGHDIRLTLDNDPTKSYILNDNFQSDPNSYTSGVATYRLPALSNGKHTLTFKVSDLLNNSSTSSIEFEVISGLAPQIFAVYNYPNPVKSNTSIIVQHDRPETILSTTVEIFDLTGRKIWSFSQANADNISWDLISTNGQKVKNGIYLYRVNIKTTDSNVTSKTNKMLILEQ